MKQEDINKLKQNNFFTMLETATNSNYIVGLSSKKIKIFSQIARDYNIQLRDWSCNNCCLSNIKAIGKIAVQDKIEETKPIKKVGRPKKYTKTN